MKKYLSSFFLSILLLALMPSAFAYTDLDESHKYYESINYISDKNIVSGYSDGSYQPDRILNRAELLKIVIEANYTDEFVSYSDMDCFDDVVPGEWYTQYVCFASEKGIVVGYTDGTFRPTDEINLVEGVKIGMEVFGHEYPVTEPWYKGFIDEAAKMQFLPSDFNSFDQRMTRGQMAELIARILKHAENQLDPYLEGKQELYLTYEILGNLNVDVLVNTYSESPSRDYQYYSPLTENVKLSELKFSADYAVVFIDEVTLTAGRTGLDFDNTIGEFWLNFGDVASNSSTFDSNGKVTFSFDPPAKVVGGDLNLLTIYSNLGSPVTDFYIGIEDANDVHVQGEGNIIGDFPIYSERIYLEE